MKSCSLLMVCFSILLTLITISESGTQERRFNLSEILAPDTSITIGSLDNGLTFYIKENKKPEKRAELRLVVNAGSVLEDDDQQGLAHFVEHMAFNGTKSFPKQEIIDFLEKYGVRFGPHLNAYTSFDQTVYMLQVPTDSPMIVQKGFKILQEWANAIAFNEKEIDKERGVLVEEWRLGQGAYERISNKHYPVIFYQSQYAKRLPIGKKEVLDTSSYESIRRFYRQWYRPNLMAVVAVGDFNKSEIEKLIRDDFTALRNPDSTRARPKYTLPDHQVSLASVATDPEMNFSTVQVLFKRNLEEQKSVAAHRRYLLNQIYDGMLNARLAERMRQSDPPYVFAYSGNNRFVGEKQAYVLYVGVKDKEIARGLEAILTEAFKVKQHGFTATELERQKKEILRNIEQAYRERDKTESRSSADEFIRNFLQDEAIPGVAVERDLSNYFVPNVTLAEINSLAAIRLNDGNRVVTVSSPKKDGFVPPTENEVLKILEEASTKKVDAYVDNIITKPLVEKKPKPGTVTKTKEIKEYSITEWTLSNGARVILKPTDFKNDEIVFSAYSRGGTSLASDKDFISAANAAATVSEGGVGEFDATTLRKLLAGKIVSVNPGISELSENFSGNASPEDLETLFQLVHLYFTSPRKDTAAAQAYLARQKAFVENNRLSPESAFRDTFYVTTSQYHFRSRPMTVKILDEYNFDRAIAFYKDRYADANDFIFFFIGNFDLVKMKPFVEQYLASLPNLKRKESWRDVNRISPKGVIEKEVRKGIDPKSYVLMSFTGSFEWNLQNLFDFQAMTEVLDIKLREVIREDKSGTYGVDVSGSPSFFPRKEYSITIWFGCAPERVKELTQAVLQQIDSIKLKQPEQVYMDKVKEMTRRELQVNRRENRWWLSTLRTFYANGEDLPPLSQVEKMIENLSGTAIQTAVSRYFNMNNYVRVVLFPEKKE